MDIRKENGYAHCDLVKERQQNYKKVKLCGYLKKKRNKVGGWRKMWFVLQDKLLLSYGSKEEYDNKLVSFKDVLNLVPGTLVRPLDGLRFTIETTTQTMYTFHCDDGNAYREWIERLLESLTTTKSTSAAPSFTPRFCNFSMDSIPHGYVCISQTHNMGRRGMTNSLDSVAQAENAQPTPAATVPTLGGVRLPIVHKTAKILERNGVNESQMDSSRKANMNGVPTREANSDRLHNYYNRRRNHAYERKQLQELRNELPVKTNDAYGYHHYQCLSKELTEKDAADKSHRDHQYERTSDKVNDLNGGGCLSERKAYDTVKDRIQRLNIRGSREEMLEETTTSMDQQRNKVITTTTTCEEHIVMRKELIREDLDLRYTKSEPIYAVVNLKDKYEARKLRNSNLELKRCNSYDSIMQSTSRASSSTRYEKTASASDEDIEGIYEDGEKFYTNKAYLSPKAEEENIYEPINIASSGSAQPNSHPLWKYFTRLKINSFMDLTRIRKRSSDYDSIKFPPASPSNSHFSTIKHKFGSHRKSMQVRVKKLCTRAYEPKSFFKHHNQQSTAIISGATVPNLLSNNNNRKKTKYRWKSVKIRPKIPVNSFNGDRKPGKYFFGSLPHMRRTRLSLFSINHARQLEDKTESERSVDKCNCDDIKAK